MARRIDATLIAYIVAIVAAAGSSPARPFASQSKDSMPRSAQAPPGQVVTPLADGRLLVTGGEGSLGSAEIRDPATGIVSPLPPLGQGRAWHSMTMLPDGRVLVFGGVDQDGQSLSAPEVFDPGRQRFEFLPTTTLQPRARHTATLLTDGRVLLAGGNGNGIAVASIDLWNSSDRTATTDAAVLARPRVGHTAILQADGSIRLSGGTDPSGIAILVDEVFDPSAGVLQQAPPRERVVGRRAVVSGVVPSDGTADVPTDTIIAVRFDRPVTSSADATCCATLSGPNGVVPGLTVPAEGGRLWFLTPFNALAHSTSYDVLVSGSVVATFQTTRAPADADRAEDPEIWNPSAASGWKTGRTPSPWQSLPPLAGPSGVTALAGQVLTVSGVPLEGVTVAIGAVTGQTDATGRFVLAPLVPGTQVLEVHGHAAGASLRNYGMHEIQVDVVQGRTVALPFTIWLSPIDELSRASLVGLNARTARSNRVPGLEVNMSAGSVLRERNGRALASLSITPLPIDRAPVPAPPGVQALAFFSLQTHGAQVTGGPGSRVNLVYPNTLGLPPGSAVDLWTYDAYRRGWAVTGRGTVTPDGKRVSSVTIASFDSGSGSSGSGGSGSGGSGSGGNSGPGGGRSGSGSVNCLQLAGSSWLPPSAPTPGNGAPDGDPVDMGTGLFVYNKTDLVLPDVLPLALTRTYRQNDATSRTFGIGSSHPYDLILTGEYGEQFADLVLPDGGAVHFIRTSSGTGHVTAVMLHTATRTSFYKSVLTWNTSRPGWDIALTDGSIYKFGTVAATGARLVGIADRYGNEIAIERDGIRIRRIVSPNGRLLEFTYDGSDRVTQVKDSIGRTVAYTYDGSGRLSQVTNTAGGTTQYTYDTSHRMLTITDPRNITYLTNVYDGSGRVDTQTQADGGVFDFSYTVNGSGAITQTDVINPLGYTRRATFSNQLPGTDTNGLGQSIEQTTSYTRVTGTALLESVTDPLGRVTRFSYDTNGHATSIIRLYGTSDAVETTATYESTYGELASVTDPLSHTTSLTSDGLGRLSSATSPLNHQRTFTTNAAGQVIAVTNPLSHTTQLSYQFGDLVNVQTPSGNIASRFLDGAGRMIRLVDPLGRPTRFEYNALNEVTKIMDPLGGETTLAYDGNGNLLTLTDARGKTTTWTYNNMDRIATRTDPLNRQESFTYDLNGNLLELTDSKGQVTVYEYDALRRQTFVGFGTTGTPPTYQSTISTTFDAANRATSIVDSGAGTISRTYDLLDRLTQETTPEGTVSYTYDAAGRRTGMQIAGQTAISYTYDNGDRLTAVTQGSASVSIAYDNGDRRTSLTLPNGIVVEYSYDNDSQLTALIYKLGGTTLGTLVYEYDAGGQRTAITGSWARSNLPPALTSASYDDANQIATWASTSFSYDANGNLTADSSQTYTWNARNELTAISGGVSASFAYDATGRRRSRTVAGSAKQYLYDGLNPVQELATGTPVANLLTGLGIDEYFTRTDNTGVDTYLTDALGTSVALANGSGSVQTEYSYEPFGAATVSGSATGNTLAFTGRETDGTGSYFYRARYYDPRLQRFLTRDPVASFGDPLASFGDSNLYSYAHQNPVRFVDPDGRIATAPLIAAAVIAVWIYKCQSNAKQQAESNFKLFDKKMHCFASCYFNRCMGLSAPGPTLMGGLLWEVFGVWRGWDSVKDMMADAYGVASSYNVFASCKTMCDACPVK